MRKRALVVIGGLLFCLSQIGVNFLIYKYKNKNVDIPRVQLRDVEENKKDKKKSFAIMLEQDDGSYAVTDSNSFNQPGYKFNTEKSGCVDINGNKVEGVLNYNETTKTIGVVTSKTVYCYVYFDKNPSGAEVLINSGNLWQSGLEGDGYRYAGTNPNNYICFGVSDKATCTGNTDAYMYRIIGVFADSSGNKHMKLIKKESLSQIVDGSETGYAWNDSNSDVDWGSSTLKNNLNGTLFLSNTTYMPNGWSDRIADWTWNTVNTKTRESLGPSYYSITAKNVYLHEMNKSGALSKGVHGTTVGKIGLMYVSDYLLALGTTASLEYKSNANKADYKASWMYIANNDIGNPGYNYEWTISRGGCNTDTNFYFAWGVYSDGSIGDHNVMNISPGSVRPVFYLNSDETISSGTGSLSDPYILGA